MSEVGGLFSQVLVVLPPTRNTGVWGTRRNLQGNGKSGDYVRGER